MDILLLAGGLALLSVGADRFVLGAARLSTALRISPVVVGALVIGFGTSAPELVVTVLATLQGSQDLAFGNVVGSNTANVLLVIGAAGLVRPVAVAVRTVRRELPLMLVSVTLLAALTVDRRVTSVDALLLLVAAVVVIGLVLATAMSDREAGELLGVEVGELEAGRRPSIPRAGLVALAGLVATLAGAQVLVVGATNLARGLGVSEAVIGLTIVAIGTSLPELVTGVAAARRNEADLVVGNVLGSNVFNSLLVAGTAGLLDTVDLDPAFGLSLAVMLASAVLVAVFLRTGHRIARGEAALLLGLFTVATVLTF